MGTSMTIRQQIQDLIAESEVLQTRFSRWQGNDPTPDAAEIQRGERDYLDWYSRALKMVPEPEAVDFRDMYEGGSFVQRIRAFLAQPLTVNQFYNPEDPNPLISQYQIPFEPKSRESLVEQRRILLSALHQAPADVVSELDKLTDLFRHLPDFVAVLRQAEDPQVPAPALKNEYGLQTLVHGLLRLRYGDVRPEDAASQHAGGASRIDFALPEVGVVVETKMTRISLKDKRLGEELLVDWGRYGRHPDCRAIFALVFDPERLLKNPTGLVSDLSQDEGNPVTRVLIIH